MVPAAHFLFLAASCLVRDALAGPPPIPPTSPMPRTPPSSDESGASDEEMSLAERLREEAAAANLAAFLSSQAAVAPAPRDDAAEHAHRHELARAERERQHAAPPSLLSDPVAAPLEFGNHSSSFKVAGDRTYLVRMGTLSGFLWTNGPPEITRYNLNQVRGWGLADGLVVRHQRNTSHEKVLDCDDSFELTEAGRDRLLSTPTACGCWWELSCSGRSTAGREPPNCQRQCCRGFGECDAGCDGPGNPFGYCKFRVRISADLHLVSTGSVLVELVGSHVPLGMPARPPPLDGLRPAPAVMRDLVDGCIAGTSKPMASTQIAAGKLSAAAPDAPKNSRFQPSRKQVESAVAWERRKGRGGGGVDDATLCDQIIRRHLISRGRVLLHRPGELLVLATDESLEHARIECFDCVASDAKKDTSSGQRCCWSSMRGRCISTGLFQPIAAWIAPEETTETIRAAGTAIRANVKCLDKDCPHPLIEVHGDDGSYARRYACSGWWSPAMVIDKHAASYLAFQLAGYGLMVLCDWHGAKCISDKCDELGIWGAAVDHIAWAWRLIKRSGTVELAFQMYDRFVTFVLALAALDQPLFSLETAEELCVYMRKCWMYPRVVLLSWIDAERQKQPSLLTVTGSCEAGHAEFDSHFLKSERNQLVANIVMITGGFDSLGRPVPRSFFDLYAIKHRDALGDARAGKTKRELAGVRLRRAKAALYFLEHGQQTSCVSDTEAGDCTLVPQFQNSMLRRHAELTGESRRGAVPALHPLLAPARRHLAYGGAASLSKADYHSVHNSTGCCDCLDSTYHGQHSAVSPCKHEHLRRLEAEVAESTNAAVVAAFHVRAAKEAADAVAVGGAPIDEVSRVDELVRQASRAARTRVAARCGSELMGFVHARESGKPARDRCFPLMEASHPTRGSIDETLEALQVHASVPGTGRGTARAPDAPPPPSAPDASDSPPPREPSRRAAAKAGVAAALDALANEGIPEYDELPPEAIPASEFLKQQTARKMAEAEEAAAMATEAEGEEAEEGEAAAAAAEAEAAAAEAAAAQQLSCTFALAVGGDLGLRFCKSDDGTAIVTSWARRSPTEVGPPRPVSGLVPEPGDTILSVEGDVNVAEYIDSAGALQLPPAAAATVQVGGTFELTFARPERPRARSLGGNPAKKGAKYLKRKAALGASLDEAAALEEPELQRQRQPELAGGHPRRMGHKPQKTPAAHKAAAPPVEEQLGNLVERAAVIRCRVLNTLSADDVEALERGLDECVAAGGASYIA